jgi:parallel beta-helix repeat protein
MVTYNRRRILKGFAAMSTIPLPLVASEFHARQSQANQKLLLSSEVGLVGDGETDNSHVFKSITFGAENILILLEPGIYMISQPIELSSNSALKGWSAEVTTIMLIADAVNRGFVGRYVIGSGVSSKAGSISISDLTVDGDWARNVDHGIGNKSGNQVSNYKARIKYLIQFDGCKDVIVKNCVIKRSYGGGIDFRNCENILVTQNNVQVCRNTGINFREGINKVGVSKSCVVSDNIVSACHVGIHAAAQGASHTVISSNLVYDCRVQNSYPDFAYGGTYPNVYPIDSDGNVVDGFNKNTVEAYVSPIKGNNNSGAAIEVNAARAFRKSHKKSGIITISGNTTTDSKMGIRLDGEQDEVTISGNTITDCERFCISVFSGTSININGNTCARAQYDGIRLAGIPERKDAQYDNTTSSIVTANNISDCGRWGVYAKGTINCMVSNNIIQSGVSPSGPDMVGGCLGVDNTKKSGHDYNMGLFVSGNNMIQSDPGGNYIGFVGDVGGGSVIISANNFTGESKFRLVQSQSVRLMGNN